MNRHERRALKAQGFCGRCEGKGLVEMKQFKVSGTGTITQIVECLCPNCEGTGKAGA